MLSTRAANASSPAAGWVAADPGEAVEGDVAGGGEGDAFALEELALDGAADGIEDGDAREVPRVLADHALPGEAAAGGGAHGGADRARGAGVAGELGDLAVGDDAAARDAAHDRVELAVEALDRIGVAGPRHRSTLRQEAVQIQVRYFAVFRERLGCESETIELPDDASVGAALEALEARHEVVRALRGRFQIAVNQEMVRADARLADGDELVLIPPVAGGDDRHARLLDEPLSLDRVMAAVASLDTGGVVTFTGLVRRSSGGRAVERLEYEAYREMAEKVLRALCDEIEADFAGTKVAVEHRVGKLVVGDIAVVIAAAAPHRAEAFAACRALIDRLKERVPIWKKEIGPDGAEWVGLGP